MCFAAASLAVSGSVFAGTPQMQQVQVESGSVSSGTPMAGSDVTVFKGIPFAAAPVGPLRWKAPQATQSWRGVRSGEQFGKACIQGPAPFKVLEVGEQDEDCLYLNVWTAAKLPTDKLPVIFWIHGGGLTTGSGAIYPGEYLARKNAVVVSFNYRLGVFGFMTHSGLAVDSGIGSEGIYGHLDQIAALTWVKRNIANFGGDADNITIAGQSSGASSVTMLMSTNYAKDLFQKAILNSGFPADMTSDLTAADKLGATLASKLNCDGARSAGELSCLRNSTAKDVFAASDKIGFAPVVDGVYWTQSPAAAFKADQQSQVPVLAGSTRDEGQMFVRNAPIFGIIAYRYALGQYFGDFAGEVYSAFTPSSSSDAKPMLGRVATAAFYTTSSDLLGSSQGERHLPFYQYQFSRVAPNTEAYKMGAFHGIDMFYVFGWLNTLEGFTEVDLDLADSLQNYWVNFARSGNPNQTQATRNLAPALAQWPEYTAGSGKNYMELGDLNQKRQDICTTSKAHCDLFQRWMSSL
jgi:para-nitrobenzyl esterase